MEQTNLNLKIILDNRERELIPFFKNDSIILEESNLDIGDIHFYKNNELIIIIERKSLSDLSASIKDGRYKEQKQRLLYAIDHKIRKIYFIEGDNMNDFHLQQSVFDGIMLSNVIRDKIMIYRTKNIEDTYLTLKRIYEHLPKWLNENWDVDALETIEYSGIKSIKKENVTYEVAFKAMISTIPGISNSIASVLYEKYKSIENMINIIKEEGDDWVQRMNNIGNIEFGSNKKRIGDSIAKKIILYFFNLNEDELKEIEDENFGKKPKKTRKKKDTLDLNTNNNTNLISNNLNETSNIINNDIKDIKLENKKKNYKSKPFIIKSLFTNE
jgi:ERCC4-type nuclease